MNTDKITLATLLCLMSFSVIYAQNVGIGTANPQEKLHIDGYLRGNQSGAVRVSTGSGYVDIGPKNTSWAHFQTDRPRYYFNTGMSIDGGEISSYSTNNLSLQTNEVTRMTILQSNGYIGIGTTAPVSKFEIEGNAQNWNTTTPGTTVGTFHLDPGSSTDDIGNAITFGAHDAGNGDNAQAGIYVRSDGSYGTKMYFGTTDSYAAGSKMRMMIDNIGRVGIGTASPSYGLDVSNTGRFTGQLSIPLTPTANAHAASKKYVDDQVGAVTETDPTWSGSANTSSSIGRTGNVGIGTTSPGTKLTVNGSVEFSGNPRYYQNLASYNSSSSSVTGIMKIVLPKSWSNTMMQVKIKGYNYSSGRGAWEVTVGGYNYAPSTSWYNYNTTVTGSPPFTRVRLSHDGTRNVILLGDVSTVWNYPKLSVTEFTAGHSSMDGWGSGWSIVPITSEAGLSSTVEAPIRIYVDNSGRVGIGLTNPSVELHVNGRIKSNGINETSDGRLKKNVKSVENALDKIMALRGVNYEWRIDEFPEKKFPKGLELGVIAQEIENVLPEVVDTDNEGYKSVQYSHIVPVLIEAIKEQQVQIAQLQNDNKDLNAQVEDYNTLFQKLDLARLIQEFGTKEYSVKK